MDIVNIYGHLSNKSPIIIGVGNYNSIHGLLTYSTNSLQMISLPEIVTPNVLELILTYETPSNSLDDDKIYFTLAVKNTDKYININIEFDGTNNIAYAELSSKKAFFWIDYSSIDRNPRSQLLAGALYSFKTTLGEQNYIVTWKIKDFPNGELVIFLPTTWYESINNFCQINHGIITLVENLNQITFKGYTTPRWCQEASNIIHCGTDMVCGNCMGPCDNSQHICYINPSPQETRFICGPKELEPKMTVSSTVSVAEPSQTQTQTSTNTTVTWGAIFFVFVIVIIIAWAIFSKST